jgi:hypothetical protein
MKTIDKLIINNPYLKVRRLLKELPDLEELKS